MKRESTRLRSHERYSYVLYYPTSKFRKSPKDHRLALASQDYKDEEALPPKAWCFFR